MKKPSRRGQRNWQSRSSKRLISCRAKSTPDMINKMKIVEEESDETEYWLELLVEAELAPQEKIKNIYKETDEILAMTVASPKTLRGRQPVHNRKHLHRTQVQVS